MKRFLLFFVLILGFVSATFAQTGTVPEVDYSAMITTFAGFVGGVVLLTEGIKALFPKMQGLATQIVSWCVGIVAAMLLWWLDAGFVADATWYNRVVLRVRCVPCVQWCCRYGICPVAHRTVLRVRMPVNRL
ncbi:hypothetical protein INE74_01614 [Bacteroides ovatus CL03T12C18]|nr:hypothetical protein [Bacteroides ovatus CL03T12C18]